MKILTEADLRSAILPQGCREYKVASDTYVTPLAKEYLEHRRIKLVLSDAPSGETMAVTPIENKGARTYIDAVSGKGYAAKPENMTHLRGNLLVSKTSPRIALRGRLDSLEADIICTQVAAEEAGMAELAAELQEALSYTRDILAAEVRGSKFVPGKLFGMDQAQLRYASQHVYESLGINHIVPSAKLGEVGALLNRLRTRTRECELAAVRAFDGESDKRTDIVQALNRLSSGIYILTCRLVAQGRGGTR
jgi:ethanolamine utilization cobalamin adenosyltransferase